MYLHTKCLACKTSVTPTRSQRFHKMRKHFQKWVKIPQIWSIRFEFSESNVAILDIVIFVNQVLCFSCVTV